MKAAAIRARVTAPAAITVSSTRVDDCGTSRRCRPCASRSRQDIPPWPQASKPLRDDDVDVVCLEQLASATVVRGRLVTLPSVSPAGTVAAAARNGSHDFRLGRVDQVAESRVERQRGRSAPSGSSSRVGVIGLQRIAPAPFAHCSVPAACGEEIDVHGLTRRSRNSDLLARPDRIEHRERQRFRPPPSATAAAISNRWPPPSRQHDRMLDLKRSMNDGLANGNTLG